MLIYTLNMIAPTDVLFVNRDVLYVPNETHCHEFVELEYIISGTGVQIINGKEYQVKRGDVIFIGLDDVHAYYSTNKIEVLNLIIHPSLYEMVQKTLSNIFVNEPCQLPPFLRMTTEYIMEVENLILKIEDEFNLKNYGYKQVLNNYVTILFIVLYRISLNLFCDDQINNEKKEITEYIESNYRYIKLEDIARHFSYSPSYFSKYFKRIMGLSLTDYVQRKRVNHAIQMLAGTRLSIEEIINEIGYSDKKNFYHIFKKYTGSTPNEIRKNVIGYENGEKYSGENKISRIRWPNNLSK